MKRLIKAFPATATVVAVAAFCIACLYFQPGPIVRLDFLVYDRWMKLAPKPEPRPEPVIVDIDDKSLENLGQWPWPRTLLAELVKKILASGALAIGFDMILAEPDRSSPIFLQKSLAERHGVNMELEGVPPELLDNDQYFAEAIRGKPVVLGAYSIFNSGKLPEKLPKSASFVEISPPDAPELTESVQDSQGLLTPLQKFSDVASIGIITAVVSNDGIIRAVHLLTRAGENIYPALSLATLMAAQESRALRLKSDINGLDTLQTNDIVIPVEPNSTFRPFFMGPAGTYPYYSVIDVLDNKVGPKELEGRIVFIGTSAAGLQDIRATPLVRNIPGVEVHANIVDNILSGKKIIYPSNIADIQTLAICLSSCLVCALVTFLPALLSTFGIILMVCACLGGSWLYFKSGIFISPVYALMAILLTGAVFVPLRFWHEQKIKMQIKSAFSHYVSPEVVNRIASTGLDTLSGQSREVSVLFTDVRNFTTISENMKPDELVRLLNNYFTPMTACVKAREGTLDKFIGDALMAFWNAPLDIQQHQQKAVLAAMDMQKKLAQLRPVFQQEFNVEMRIGAGIHCGLVQVGNMGSSDLFNYTCIGDNVNLASRLEGVSKKYGAGIIVSSAIMEQCPGVRFRMLDRITVKGSSTPLDIYTPVDEEDYVEDFEERWRNALEEYLNGDFKKAFALFEALGQQYGSHTAIDLFMTRCSGLLDEPPTEWTGVFHYDSK